MFQCDRPGIQRSLRLLKFEGALTSTIMSMPFITLFWQLTLGMSWGQIVALQLVFMVVMIVTNVPTGYLADRISPRKANIIGDLIAAAGWLLYAISPNFETAVLAEIILGLGIATSSDADKSLMRWYCQRLAGADNPHYSDYLYDRHQGRQQLASLAAGIPSMVIGGWLGLEGARIAMVLTAICAVLGAVLAYFLTETGPLRSGSVTRGTWQFTKHAWADMWQIIRFAAHTPRLAWSLAAQAVGSELTHASVWLLTPMLIFTGTPKAVVGAAWAANLGLAFFGNILPTLPGCRNWYIWARPPAKFAVGAVMALGAMATFAVSVNATTVWLFGFIGLTRGWFSRVSSPIVMADTPSTMLSTIGSLGSTLYRLLYFAPMLLLLATSQQSYEIMYAAQLALFLPLSVAVFIGLKTTHRR